MELLLFLSAIFTALTGVVTGERAPAVPAEQVSRVAVAAAEQLAVVRPTRAPVQAFAVTAARRSAVPVVRLSLDTPPLYASRRRE